MSEATKVVAAGRMPENSDRNEFDFYRCGKCGRLATLPEMRAGLPKGSICPCGSLKYSPCNPRWWQYFLPRVLTFAFQRLRGTA